MAEELPDQIYWHQRNGEETLVNTKSLLDRIEAGDYGKNMHLVLEQKDASGSVYHIEKIKDDDTWTGWFMSFFKRKEDSEQTVHVDGACDAMGQGNASGRECFDETAAKVSKPFSSLNSVTASASGRLGTEDANIHAEVEKTYGDYKGQDGEEFLPVGDNLAIGTKGSGKASVSISSKGTYYDVDGKLELKSDLKGDQTQGAERLGEGIGNTFGKSADLARDGTAQQLKDAGQ